MRYATIKLPENCLYCAFNHNGICRRSKHDVSDNVNFFSTKPLERPKWCTLQKEEDRGREMDTDPR